MQDSMRSSWTVASSTCAWITRPSRLKISVTTTRADGSAALPPSAEAGLHLVLARGQRGTDPFL
jgi:hypothetical protein